MKNVNKPKIVVIVGPTASGKSALAVEIAKRFGGEVVSADARQVYRGLDVGTAKITRREMRGVRHHLIDVASPRQHFSVAAFVRLADAAIADIARRGKLPIVAGGTGLYVDALLRRVNIPDVPPDAALRRTLAKRSPKALFAALKRLDPKRARSIEADNPRRLIRAIEIAKALGKVPSPRRRACPYDAILIGIALPSSVLEQRIRQRAARLKNEVRRSRLRQELRSMRAQHISWKRIGELGFEYLLASRILRGETLAEPLHDAVARMDLRYVKRQLRYLRRNQATQWVSAPEQALHLLDTNTCLCLTANGLVP